MVEIGGKPIVWHIMKLYAHHGITEFILCLGYKAYVIKDYFLNYEARNSDFTVELGKNKAIHYAGPNHAEDGWKVTLAFTGENAMTGARVARAARYLDETGDTFCLTYGDGVSDVDLGGALEYHKSHGKLATITGVRPPSRFGEIKEDGGRVLAFGEKPPEAGGFISGGYFFLEREFLNYVQDDDACILERKPFERCAADGQMCVYDHTGYWECMDTYRDWMRLQKLWESGNAPWAVWGG